eukprot:449745-Prymnesium_polylepis.1
MEHMRSQLELTGGDEKMPNSTDGTPKFILTDGRTDGDLSYLAFAPSGLQGTDIDVETVVGAQQNESEASTL